MPTSRPRQYLRRQLEAHLSQLGYSCARAGDAGGLAPEIVRVSPIRGRIAYGETVLRSDLGQKSCHERLRYFSQRRTRRRTTILLFIGVAAADKEDLEALLEALDIRTRVRGGHILIVPFSAPRAPRRRVTRQAGSETTDRPIVPRRRTA